MDKEKAIKYLAMMYVMENLGEDFEHVNNVLDKETMDTWCVNFPNSVAEMRGLFDPTFLTELMIDFIKEVANEQSN